jgi:hypothetical protein
MPDCVGHPNNRKFWYYSEYIFLLNNHELILLLLFSFVEFHQLAID